jgi:hypothetical protein
MTFSSFGEAWQFILTNLTPRPSLNHWTAAGRTTGYSQILAVNPSGIDIRVSNGNERKVSRSDFEKLYPYWAAYRDGKLSISELEFVSHNRLYVFAVLHWMEIQQPVRCKGTN